MEFSFPKVELHLHIDCSLSFNFVSKYVPGITIETYQKIYNTPVNCCSLNDYLACAQAAIALMQTHEQLYDATKDVIAQLEKEQVLYAELRFAPLQHLLNGLSPNQVVESCLKAIEDYHGPVKVNLILCTLRHFTKEQSDLTADLVVQYYNKGVVGFDLAADEAGFNLENHRDAFQRLHALGIFCTSHAGEARGAESVRETIKELKVSRIGHGIRSTEDTELLEDLKQNNIHLEICPTSNHITRVYPEGNDYPVNTLLQNRNSFGINTDGRAISNVTLVDEYKWLMENKGWTIYDLYYVNLSALEAAFISENERETLRFKLIQGFENFIDSSN